MITRFITLSAGTSIIMTTLVTTMQTIIETNFERDKIAFKMSYDKQNLTLTIISYKIYYKLPKGLFDKFHMK